MTGVSMAVKPPVSSFKPEYSTLDWWKTLMTASIGPEPALIPSVLALTD
jgi:hypothetical protein